MIRPGVSQRYIGAPAIVGGGIGGAAAAARVDTDDSDHLFDHIDNTSTKQSDLLAKRAQLVGTMSSYSVYQLSEASQHRQFVECESEAMDIFDGTTNLQSRASHLTTHSPNAAAQINAELDDEERERQPSEEFQPKFSVSNAHKRFLRPAIFDLIEMEVARHKSHSIQNYLSIVEQKAAEERKKALTQQSSMGRDSADVQDLSKQLFGVDKEITTSLVSKQQQLNKLFYQDFH